MRDALGDEAFDATWSEGRAMAMEEKAGCGHATSYPTVWGRSIIYRPPPGTFVTYPLDHSAGRVLP